MSKTYIQEVLSTRDNSEEIIRVESLPNGMWHVHTSLGHYIVKPGSVYLSDHLQLDTSVTWIDEATANTRVTREGLLHISWSDFIAFVLDGEMNAVLEEYTAQQLTKTWESFQDLRALQIIYYTPCGLLVLPIDASCAEPWARLDYSKPMPAPDGDNCVAFLGHGELGYPPSFLRKIFEFGLKKNEEGFPN